MKNYNTYHTHTHTHTYVCTYIYIFVVYSRRHVIVQPPAHPVRSIQPHIHASARARAGGIYIRNACPIVHAVRTRIKIRRELKKKRNTGATRTMCTHTHTHIYIYNMNDIRLCVYIVCTLSALFFSTHNAFRPPTQFFLARTT